MIIDILMYCKYKIVNGVSVEGITDLIRKTKSCLLKLILTPDFLKVVIAQSAPGFEYTVGAGD